MKDGLPQRLSGRLTWMLSQDFLENMVIDEEEFFEIMEDPFVKRILEDLDVSMFNAAGMFDTFDPDGVGYISISGLVQAVMKLRGEPQKNDLIASVLALRALHAKVDHLQSSLDTRPQDQSVSMSSGEIKFPPDHANDKPGYQPVRATEWTDDEV